MRLLTAEKRYHTALTHWQQYENWKATRNKKRSELEAKFGYDCKHASHLVRLLRIGEEILSTGKVQVKRLDAEELLEIRAGKWSYEKIVEYAEKMDNKLKKIYESKRCAVPHAPDRKALDKLLIELTEEMLK